ncbi:hypothetical protein N7540_004252 [Penicillium herquei]|nr:hypothetical protein N7540_004252 [Penicillium herquei]
MTIASDSDSAHDRWLKDAEVWAPEDDWSPNEYYQWCMRLKEARKNLKAKYQEVDQSVINEMSWMAQDHKPSENDGDYYNLAHILTRYIIAYNFYSRASFEDITEKQYVARVQKHLARMYIGMNDSEIARMLQYAADKLILSAKVDGALPTVADMPAIYVQANEQDPDGLFAKSLGDRYAKILDTDENIKHFVRWRSETNFVRWTHKLEVQCACVKLILEKDGLDKVCTFAEKAEKENLSWERTIGPAVTAIRRLGKRSAGKDAEKLAEYARAHAQRPQ